MEQMPESIGRMCIGVSCGGGHQPRIEAYANQRQPRPQAVHQAVGWAIRVLCRTLFRCTPPLFLSRRSAISVHNRRIKTQSISPVNDAVRKRFCWPRSFLSWTARGTGSVAGRGSVQESIRSPWAVSFYRGRILKLLHSSLEGCFLGSVAVSHK